MDPVQPPERRHGVVQHMLGIDHEIQRHHAQEHLQPMGQAPLIEQPPAPLGREKGETDGQNGIDQRDRQRVQGHDGEVGEPAPALGGCPRPAGRANLRRRQNGEDAEEGPQANGGVGGHRVSA